jgi:hypothetical protein
MGFMDAFRASFRPMHVRQDLAALPWIATHSHALWVPLVITIASAVATAVAGTNSLVINFIFPYFVMFPAVGGVFIGGFLAPRASWLIGIVVGLVSASCYVALGYANALPPGFQAQFALSPEGSAVTSLIWSAILGAFFAAAAAWYRRFLRLSSPNRTRAGQSKAQKGGQSKVGDGRTRAGTSQKSAAKR